jgi:hypothetical protein
MKYRKVGVRKTAEKIFPDKKNYQSKKTDFEQRFEYLIIKFPKV